MYLQFKNYRNANEVLYVLDAAHRISDDSVSKLGLQKLLYLSACFAPIKDIVLSILRFSRWHRGPYSPQIQNTVDHLVAYGLVDITEFKQLQWKASIAYYKISDGGTLAVEKLKKYSVENDKAWWIDCITRLAYAYSEEEILQGDEEFSGLDTIVRMVYQEGTFISIDASEGKGGTFNFEMDNGITAQIIKLTKEHIQNNSEFQRLSYKEIAELILVAFFEQLYINTLDQNSEKK